MGQQQSREVWTTDTAHVVGQGGRQRTRCAKVAWRMSRSAAMRCASAGQAFGSLRMRTCSAPHRCNPGCRGR